MENIPFTFNWNNKLNCDAFTTIRLENQRKYVIGNTYEILLKKQLQFIGTIIDIRNFYLNDLNNFVAMINTGYSKEECKNIILKMYPTVNFSTKKLSLILIKKLK